MWIFSKYGFYSITEVPGKTGLYQIRSRNEVDLINLLKECHLKKEIVKKKNSDYEFRIYVKHSELIIITKILTLSIDYDNFKDVVSTIPNQQKKLSAYHEIWFTMLKVSDKFKD